jgi:muramidase (phage lysozyme)
MLTRFRRPTRSVKVIGAVTVALFAGADTFANAAEHPAQLAQDALACAEMGATIAAIAGGEAKGFKRLVGGSKFSDISKFPQRRGFKGSHAAGLFQDEPSTWRAIIKANPDIKTFGRKSQIKGNVYWVQKIYADATNGRSYGADLKAKRLNRRGMAALKQQWPGGFNAGFWGRYAKALRQMSSVSTPPPDAPSAPLITLAMTVCKRLCQSGWLIAQK